MLEKTKIAVTLGTVVVAALVAAGCAAPSGATGSGAVTQAPLATKETIAALFDQWNAALATGDPAKVADLYATHAVLLPTVSNEIRVDRDDIIDYFVKFLKNKPQGKIDRQIVDVVDENTAINTGVYTFTLTQDGKPQQVTARYTYVYELIGGKWLIVNHHSSVMPPK